MMPNGAREHRRCWRFLPSRNTMGDSRKGKQQSSVPTGSPKGAGGSCLGREMASTKYIPFPRAPKVPAVPAFSKHDGGFLQSKATILCSNGQPEGRRRFVAVSMSILGYITRSIQGSSRVTLPTIF